VAVLNAGELQQVDRPDRLYAEPENLFVASFLGSPGMNVFPVTLTRKENGLVVLLGESVLTMPSYISEKNPNFMASTNQPMLLGLRPEAITPETAESGKDALPVHVVSVESLGHENLVYFELPHDPGTRQVMRVPHSVRPQPGSGLRIQPDLRQARFFSLDGQAIAI